MAAIVGEGACPGPDGLVSLLRDTSVLSCLEIAGIKCFLGPGKSFPICARGTCRVNNKGLYAAYVRARQWGNKRSSYKGKARPRHNHRIYKSVASKAKRMLKNRGKKTHEDVKAKKFNTKSVLSIK